MKALIILLLVSTLSLLPNVRPQCTNCSICGGTQCDQCLSHFFVNNANPVDCLECSSNCLECIQQQDFCTKCDGSNSNQDTLDVSTCISQASCSSLTGKGVKLINGNKICVNCISNCFECNIFDKCTACQAPTEYLFNEACLSQQDCNNLPGFTEIDSCKQCISQCNSCAVDVSNCTSCSGNLFLENNQCVSICASGSFEDTSNNECTQCSIECSECDVIASNCSLCNNGLFLNQNNGQGNCISQVDCESLNKFVIGQNCDSCHQSCRTCINSNAIDSCTSCNAQDDKYFLMQNQVLGTGTCILSEDCANIQNEIRFALDVIEPLNNQLNGICELCDVQCAKCMVAENNCTSCSQTFLFVDSNNLGSCVQQCNAFDAQTYNNGTTFTCDNCSNNCLSCDSFDLCTSCDSQFFLTEISLTQQLCQEICDIQNGYIIFPPQSNFCVKCQVTDCKVCGNTDSCEECITDHYLFTDPINSVQSCFLDVNCPLTTFATLVNSISVCQNCSSSQTCNKCSDVDFCTECSNPALFLVVNLGTCELSCPDGSFQQNQDLICNACDSNCLTCQTQSTNCLSCQSGMFLNANKCLLPDQCPEGSFFSDNSAQSLPDTCESCINTPQKACGLCYGSSTFCTGCKGSLFLDELTNTCNVNCPAGFYKFSDSSKFGNVCKLCHKSCLTCSDSPTNCLTCDGQQYFFDQRIITGSNQCVSSCLEQDILNKQYGSKSQKNCVTEENCGVGQYGDNSTGLCLFCDLKWCLKCGNDGKCIECDANKGFEVQNGECKMTCAIGQIFDAAQSQGNQCSNGCDSAIPKCMNCVQDTDRVECMKCKDGYLVQENLFNVECVENCKDNYKEINGVCYKISKENLYFFKVEFITQQFRPPDVLISTEIRDPLKADQITFVFDKMHSDQIEYIFLKNIPYNNEGRIPENMECGSQNPKNGFNFIQKLATQKTEISLTLTQLVSCGFWEQEDENDNNKRKLMGYVAVVYRKTDNGKNEFVTYLHNVLISFNEKIENNSELKTEIKEITGIIIQNDGFLGEDATSSNDIKFYTLEDNDQVGNNVNQLIAEVNQEYHLVIELPENLMSNYMLNPGSLQELLDDPSDSIDLEDTMVACELNMQLSTKNIFVVNIMMNVQETGSYILNFKGTLSLVPRDNRRQLQTVTIQSQKSLRVVKNLNEDSNISKKNGNLVIILVSVLIALLVFLVGGVLLGFKMKKMKYQSKQERAKGSLNKDTIAII